MVGSSDSIGSRLHWARELTGLSGRQLAARAGLHPTHVGLIESGERPKPSGGTVAKLARALGVSMEWLQTGEGNVPDADALRAIVPANDTHPKAS
jgi:transcriptional regulator with XRE-family HTH domain